MSSSSTSTSLLTSRSTSILILLTGSSLLLFLSPKWSQFLKPISPKNNSQDASSSNSNSNSSLISKHLPSIPSTSNQRKPIAIFWDVDNCSPPSGSSGREIALAIRKAVQLATTPSAWGNDNQQSDNPIVVFKAYLELSAENSAPLSREQVNLRSELQGCGVTLIDTPKSGRKNVADFMMITDLLAHAIDNEPPYRIVVITGDRDFAYPVGVLRNRSYEIVLITPPVGAPPILEASANLVLSWRRDVLGISKDSNGRNYDDKRSISNTSSKNGVAKEYQSSPMKKTIAPTSTPSKPQPQASHFPQYQSSPSQFVSYQQQQQQQHNHPNPKSQTLNPEVFKPLTDLLRSMARDGDSFPLRGMVAVKLSPRIYQEVGAQRWAEYAQLAELSGAIKLGISSAIGTEWVALPEEVEKKRKAERDDALQREQDRLEKSRKSDEDNIKKKSFEKRKDGNLVGNDLVPRAVQVGTAKAVKPSISQQSTSTTTLDPSSSTTKENDLKGKEAGLTDWIFGRGNSEEDSKNGGSNEKAVAQDKNANVSISTASDSKSTTSTVKPYLTEEPWSGKLTVSLDRFHPLLEIMKQLANDYSEAPPTSNKSFNSDSSNEDSIARASKVSKSLTYLKDQNVFDPYKSSGVKDFKEYMILAESQGVARLRLKVKEKKLSKLLEGEKEKEEDSGIKGREIVVLREKYKKAYTSLPTKSAEKIKDTSNTSSDADVKQPKRSSSPIKNAFKKTLFGESEKKTSDPPQDPVVLHNPSNLPIRKSLLTLVNLLNNQRRLSNFYVTSTFIHKSFMKLPSAIIKSLKVKNKDEFQLYLKGAEDDGVIEISNGFKEGEQQIRLKREYFSEDNKTGKGGRIGDGYKAQKVFKGNEEFFKPSEDDGGDWIDEDENENEIDGNKASLSLPSFGGIASGAFDWFSNGNDKSVKGGNEEEDLGQVLQRNGDSSNLENGDEEVLDWENYSKRV